VIQPSLGPTRTEEDLVTHVRQTIATDPDDEWIFILDQLNTHQSDGNPDFGVMAVSAVVVVVLLLGGLVYFNRTESTFADVV
jgi:hypothetical protein